jgi:plastocyanin
MTKSLSVAIPAAVLLALIPASLTAGEVVGRVTYSGTPPTAQTIKITKDQAVCAKTPHIDDSLVVGADKGIKNVVVSITDVNDGKKMAVPPKNLSIDQKGCRFVPRVQIVPAGAPVDIINSDGILHNIHTFPKANTPFNKAQPKFRKVMKETFPKPDRIRIACDVHSWMSGWIVVAGHPYFGLTDEKGAFTIPDLPAGTYTIEYWHEKLGTQTAKVTVPASGQVSADLQMSME